MNNILEVKNLKISFRTNSGNVRAVRDISFDLKKGETLAIVGESGSGKSVTSKAILGILAGNSIVENGEILYDGRDLLKVSEEEMCKIRGDKIAMIFQDPLSSLDPIVKIGRQITEAMLLKNKQSRKSARIEFNNLLKVLEKNMIDSDETSEADDLEIAELISTFDNFCIEANRLENNYNIAYTNAEEIEIEIADKLFLVSKGKKIDVKGTLAALIKKLALVKDELLTYKLDGEIAETASKLSALRAAYVAPKRKENEKFTLPEDIQTSFEELEALMKKVTDSVRPNFFRIGFYKYKNPEAKLGEYDTEKLNEFALDFLQKNFMERFIKLETLGVKHAYEKSFNKKLEVLDAIKEAKSFFEAEDIERAAALKLCRSLSDLVKESIDELQYVKDSIAGSFESSIYNEVNKYFTFKKKNPKEEARFARETAKREALIARGKTVDWKVKPKVVYDLDALRANILLIMDRLYKKYEADVAVENVDFEAKAIGLIDYFKAKASDVVYRITKRVARKTAIKLMEEVGIPEPRIRFNQYPFEFSGGMRQRIVIAIALAANPDILICDEPTTALDVTIQAQILELINNLKRERNLSVIFITHDLGVVANMADRIAVMYAGKIVEEGTADDVFYDPRHPYTWALLSSMPDLDTNEKLDAIPGTPPNMIYPPVGDAFAARNKYALKIDFEAQPPMFKISDTHKAATWLLHPDAPKVEMPKIIKERINRMQAAGGDRNDK